MKGAREPSQPSFIRELIPFVRALPCDPIASQRLHLLIHLGVWIPRHGSLRWGHKHSGHSKTYTCLEVRLLTHTCPGHASPVGKAECTYQKLVDIKESFSVLLVLGLDMRHSYLAKVSFLAAFHGCLLTMLASEILLF